MVKIQSSAVHGSGDSSEKRRLGKVIEGLKKAYPKATCALTHSNPLQLLIATILSAQCTDERVNQVTPALFRRFPTAKALASASLPEVEEIIRSTGFFRQKAKSIVLVCRDLVEKHGGVVPSTMEDLTAMRGVGRKTANVVLGTAYGIPLGIVVDTHVWRLSNRLGFSDKNDATKIELDLMNIVRKEDWIWFSHAMIQHGRRICKAPLPLCPECPINSLCPYPKLGGKFRK